MLAFPQVSVLGLFLSSYFSSSGFSCSQSYNSHKVLTPKLTSTPAFSVLHLEALPALSTQPSCHHPWAHPLSSPPHLPPVTCCCFDLHLSVLLRHSTCCSTQTSPRVMQRPWACLCSVPDLKLWFILKPHPTHSSLFSQRSLLLLLVCCEASFNWTATMHC